MPADLADVGLSAASGLSMSGAAGLVPVPVPLRACTAEAPFPAPGRGAGVFFSDLVDPALSGTPTPPAWEGFSVDDAADLGLAAGADVRADLDADLPAGIATVTAGASADGVGAMAA